MLSDAPTKQQRAMSTSQPCPDGREERTAPSRVPQRGKVQSRTQSHVSSVSSFPPFWTTHFPVVRSRPRVVRARTSRDQQSTRYCCSLIVTATELGQVKMLSKPVPQATTVPTATPCRVHGGPAVGRSIHRCAAMRRARMPGSPARVPLSAIYPFKTCRHLPPCKVFAGQSSVCAFEQPAHSTIA